MPAAAKASPQRRPRWRRWDAGRGQNCQHVASSQPSLFISKRIERGRLQFCAIPAGQFPKTLVSESSTHRRLSLLAKFGRGFGAIVKAFNRHRDSSFRDCESNSGRDGREYSICTPARQGRPGNTPGQEFAIVAMFTNSQQQRPAGSREEVAAAGRRFVRVTSVNRHRGPRWRASTAAQLPESHTPVNGPRPSQFPKPASGDKTPSQLQCTTRRGRATKKTRQAKKPDGSKVID